MISLFLEFLRFMQMDSTERPSRARGAEAAGRGAEGKGQQVMRTSLVPRRPLRARQRAQV